MRLLSFLVPVAGSCGPQAYAATPAELLKAYSAASGSASPSAQRGEQFFNTTHGGDSSCATCHGKRPTRPGAHASTGKPIAPLAPAFNPERFTNAGTVQAELQGRAETGVLRRREGGCHELFAPTQTIGALDEHVELVELCANLTVALKVRSHAACARLGKGFHAALQALVQGSEK